MKRFFAIITIQFLCCWVMINAQTADKIELKDLKVPVSPAFSILDLSPKTIESPGTIKAFTVNLVTSAALSGGIPRNFAFEFAPYWFFPHPTMNIYKYYGLDTSSGKLKANIFYGLRSTSLSFGSVFKDSSKAIPVDVNYIAYAVRSNIINIRNKKILSKFKESIDNVNEALGNVLSNAMMKCANLEPGSTERIECIGKFIENSKDSLLKASRAAFSKYLMTRPQFSADLAFASSTAFGNNSFSNDHSYRTGGWLTLAYYQPLVSAKKVATNIDNLINCKNYFNAYFLLRVLKENKTKDFTTFNRQSLLDMGGRAELEFNKFSFSIEAIKRIDHTDKTFNSSRTVGILQYKINDALFLTGTFGKDFGTINNLVSLLGINWGFGENALNAPLKL